MNSISNKSISVLLDTDVQARFQDLTKKMYIKQ